MGVFLLFFAVSCHKQIEAPSSRGGAGAGRGNSGGIRTNAEGSSGGAGGSGVVADGNNPNTDCINPNTLCTTLDMKISRVGRMLVFAIDRSGSMGALYGDGSATRWQVFHDLLMDPTAGVIAKLQGDSATYIGVTFFDGGENTAEGTTQVTCSDSGLCDNRGLAVCADAAAGAEGGSSLRLIAIDPAPSNFDAIAARYTEQSTGPGGANRTTSALAAIYQSLLLKKREPEPQGPQEISAVVVLVTDGDTSACGTQQDYRDTIDEIGKAAEAGIRTVVLGIDTSSAEVKALLDNIAKFGDAETGVAFTPSNKDELINSLSLSTGGPGCLLEVPLSPPYDMTYFNCIGYVWLNSELLGCDTIDGYKIVDGQHILLRGKACDRFLNDWSAVVHAQLPCLAIYIC